MNRNLEILEKWYNGVKHFPKLKFSESQELTKKMLAQKDQNKRRLLRDQMLCGTFFCIYRFLKTDDILSVIGNGCDMDDFISATCNVWLSYIEKGALIYDKVNTYTQIFFSRNFLSQLEANLYSSTINLSKTFGISLENMTDLFEWFYINDQYQNISYPSFAELVTSRYPKISEKSIQDIYELFMFYKKYYEHQNINSEEISINKFNYFCRLILEKGIDEHQISYIHNNYYKDNHYDSLEKSEIEKYIINYSPNNPRSAQIILKAFGFEDGHPWSNIEIANYYNISRKLVWITIDGFLKRVGGIKNIQDLAKEYGIKVNAADFTQYRDYVEFNDKRMTALSRKKEMKK